jgi:hypothetical protein
MGTITPSSLAISAQRQDGAPYLGRFTIDISHDGVDYENVYTSASDESSKTYTIDETIEILGVDYYVVIVRIRLYASGGTGDLLRQQYCSVVLESNSAPVYWGAITSAPTVDILPGDYYWDNNDVGEPSPANPGTPRVYVGGDVWIEFTSSMPGYGNAMWEMVADMGAWATAQGEVVAAASAIFAKLVTADAFIANLFTQFITVGTGGRIRYETGIGVQKRTVQLADEKIDWIDTPDTSPASPEVLRARIGRLGVGGAILMDGDFYTNYTQAPVYGGRHRRRVRRHGQGHSPAH